MWICVTCGQLNCGRYVKAHALSHYEKAPEGNAHPVCLECNELSVFWCVYIINDYQNSGLDVEVNIISPQPEQIVEPEDVFVALSYFRVDDLNLE